MVVRLGVVLGGEVPARVMAAQSLGSLDRALRCPAELWVATASDDATVQGAFQRNAGTLVRGSGGAAVRVTPGTVHVLLTLASPGTLVPCDEKRIVNRYVRPLLRALTKNGALAHYFGRDWVSVSGRPVASVGFAHDAASRRATFEAFVATGAPLWTGERASFLGKEPASVPGDPARLASTIASAYSEVTDATELEAPGDLPDAQAPDEPPWAATHEEAIGTLGAGPDRHRVFRIGGDLLVSRDALARLEAAAPAAGAGDDLERLIDEMLASPGTALDGVRSLASVRDVIRAALGT